MDELSPEFLAAKARADAEFMAAKAKADKAFLLERASQDWYANQADIAASKFPKLVRGMDAEPKKPVPDLVSKLAAEAVKARGGTPIDILLQPSFKIPVRKKAAYQPPPMAVGLPEEAHPDQPAVDPTDVVEPLSRLKGVSKGVGEALAQPLQSARKGHGEAKYQAERAILTESGPSRFLADIGNIVMGVPKMAAALIEPLPKGTSQEDYGKELGKGVVEGALGGTLFTFSDPVTAFKASPLSTASTLLPVGKAFAEGAKAAGAAKYLAPVEKLAQKAHEAVPVGVRRVLGDQRAQETAFETGVAEELASAGKTTRAMEHAANVGAPRSPVPMAEGQPLEMVVEGRKDGGKHIVPVSRDWQREVAIPDLGSSELSAVVPLGDAGAGRLPQAAVVVTPARALELADELIAKAGASPTTRDVVARNILDFHKKNPQAPLPEVLAEPGVTVRPTTLAGQKERASYAALAEEDAVKRAGQTAAQRMAQELSPDIGGPVVFSRTADESKLRAGILDEARDVYDTGVVPLLTSKADKENLRLAMTRLAGEPAIDQKRLGKVLDEIDRMEPLAGTPAHATAGIAKSLATPATPPAGLLDKVSSWVKQSLTSQNPASAVNNFVSNFALQTARVGDPVSVTTRLVTAASDLAQWKLGKLDPAKAKAFEFWSRTGLLDSTLLGNDVAALSESGAVGNLFRLNWPVGKYKGFGVGGTLEAAYKFGDNLFKADEAVSSLNKYQRYSDMLKPGQTLDLAVSGNVVGRILGGSDVAELLAGGKVIRRVPKDEVLFRAAAKQAQDLFFDYGEVPEFAQWVRKAGPLSVASPFSTWFLKAIDIPGVKKGLGWRMLETPREIVGTTSATIHAEEAGRHLVTAAQRAATLNGLRNIMRDETRQDVREAVSFAPTQAKLAIVRTLADPSYLGIEKLGNWNFLGPTELLARVAIQGVGQVGQRMDALFSDPTIRKSEEAKVLREMQYLGDPKEYDRKLRELALSARTPDEVALVQHMAAAKDSAKKLTPQARAEMTRAAEFNRRLNTTGYATMDDALNLIQLGGTPVSAALDEFRKASEMGKTLQAGRVLSNVLGPMLLGGFGKNVVNVAARAAWQNVDKAPLWTKALADYKLNEDDALDQDDFLRVAIRKFTGMGWEKMAATKVTGNQIKDFAGKARAEWKSALGVTKADFADLERQIAKQVKFKNPESVRQLESQRDHLQRVLDIVDDEMGMFDENLRGLLDAVSTQKLPRTPPRQPTLPRYQ